MTIIQQYRAAKALHPDTLLLFRCGDFYESFAEDAIEIASILGLPLTGVDPGLHMAGFPVRMIDSYLPKLKEKHKVDVVEW